MWEVKKNSSFLSSGRKILPSCGPLQGAWNYDRNMWTCSLRNLNRLIHLMGPLKQSFVENISLQRCNCNIFGLTDTMALFAKEAGFYRSWVFFPASSLQSEVGDPHFFYISDITNSWSFNGKISREQSMLEKFGANVLNSIDFKSNEDMILALAGQFKQLSHEPHDIPFTGKHEPNKLTCSQLCDFVAQLVRALHRHRRGHGCESRWVTWIFQVHETIA